MHQYPRLSASRTCCDNDIFRLLVVDNLALAVREFAKEFVVFGWSDVLVNLRPALFFEILFDELAEVHCKVVVDETQRCIVVTNHQIGIFAYDMNLANALFIEFIQQTILLFAISGTCCYETSNLHGIIENDKSAFNLHQFRFGKI